MTTVEATPRRFMQATDDSAAARTALAAVIHGTETRIRRLEPDAAGVLLVYVLLLGAVWVATS